MTKLRAIVAWAGFALGIAVAAFLVAIGMRKPDPTMDDVDDLERERLRGISDRENAALAAADHHHEVNRHERRKAEAKKAKALRRDNRGRGRWIDGLSGGGGGPEK